MRKGIQGHKDKKGIPLSNPFQIGVNVGIKDAPHYFFLILFLLTNITNRVPPHLFLIRFNTIRVCITPFHLLSTHFKCERGEFNSSPPVFDMF